MRNLGLSRQNGASVVEMLIIVAVVGILATFAVSQFGTSGANLERQNMTRQFKAELDRARFDSVKRRASRCEDMSRIEVLSARTYRVITDLNQNGTTLLDNGTPNNPADDITDPSEIRTVDLTNRRDVTIVGNTLPYVIRFDQRGNTSSGPCTAPTAPIAVTTFCSMPCTAGTVNSTNADALFVSASGTVSLMHGGETVPTFNNPSVTTVTNTDRVDNRLTVWTGPPPTPSPFPSPPGTPTPIPPATPTPTPNPSGTATPTPSPTPNACAYNQNPNGNPPCTCILPMYVVTNNGGHNPRCVGLTPSPTPTP